MVKNHFFFLKFFIFKMHPDNLFTTKLQISRIKTVNFKMIFRHQTSYNDPDGWNPLSPNLWVSFQLCVESQANYSAQTRFQRLRDKQKHHGDVIQLTSTSFFKAEGDALPTFSESLDLLLFSHLSRMCATALIWSRWNLTTPCK